MAAEATEAPAKPQPGTWKEWLPPGTPEPDDLLTRAEFLERLRQRGVDVTESTLLHWERAGALPRPVRRWRGRTPATWYPGWLVPLAARIPDLQADGLELREIGPQLRAYITTSDTARVRTTENTTMVKFSAGATMAAGGGAATIVAGQATEDDISPALLALARRYERITGARVVRVEGRITDADGGTVAYVTTTGGGG